MVYRNEKQGILLSTLLKCVWGLICSESKNDPVFVLNRNVGATNMASQEGSKIMVFRPTLEEFANFSIYIRKMEEMGAHRAGVAKVSSEKIGQICFVLFCVYMQCFRTARGVNFTSGTVYRYLRILSFPGHTSKRMDSTKELWRRRYHNSCAYTSSCYWNTR